MRTLQVLNEETGVANGADPLGCSWYCESLTDRMEDEAEKIFGQIRRMGERDTRWQQTYGPMTAGILRGIEDGWFMSEIAEAAFEYQHKVEKGEKRVVGVNAHRDTVSGELDILRVSHEVETEQRRILAQRRDRRDDAAVRAALSELTSAAAGSGNMIPAMLDAARAEATLGEICDALRSEWGTYTEPARF
jgi:methylmalonyl-CoA mutase N-terminal domain/subunit